MFACNKKTKPKLLALPEILCTAPGLQSLSCIIMEEIQLVKLQNLRANRVRLMASCKLFAHPPSALTHLNATNTSMSLQGETFIQTEVPEPALPGHLKPVLCYSAQAQTETVTTPACYSTASLEAIVLFFSLFGFEI